jgi:hypothetical protein
MKKYMYTIWQPCYYFALLTAPPSAPSVDFSRGKVVLRFFVNVQITKRQNVNIHTSNKQIAAFQITVHQNVDIQTSDHQNVDI